MVSLEAGNSAWLTGSLMFEDSSTDEIRFVVACSGSFEGVKEYFLLGTFITFSFDSSEVLWFT